MSQPALQAVLFDMDDTLIDWSSWSGDWQGVEQFHLQGVYDFLVAQRHPLKTNFATFHATYGDRSRDAWISARDTLHAPHLGRILMDTLEHCGLNRAAGPDMAACLRAYRWGKLPGVTLFPDVPPLLALLRERGIRTGIVTNASQPMTLREIELEQYGLLEYFPLAPARISAADVGYLKPHRAIFEAALNALGTTPETTVFVGDNPVADIAGAQAAGMRAILRIERPAQPLISGLIVPDAAINSFSEMPAIFDKWYPQGW